MPGLLNGMGMLGFGGTRDCIFDGPVICTSLPFKKDFGIPGNITIKNVTLTLNINNNECKERVNV